MSLLQVQDDPVHEHDATAEGEDLAKGSSYLPWAYLTAVVVLCAAFAIFVLVNRKPPVAVGEVTRIWAHGVHTINTPMDANGVQSAARPFDQVLVFSQVRVRNQSDQAIVLREMLTNVTVDDGPRSSYAATATDYDRIFIAYKDLIGLKSHTLVRDTIIPPGQVLDGMVVSAFHMSPEQWAGRKDLSLTLQFKFHPDLVLVPKTPVVEQ
jgi:hypothetical protein